MSATGPIPVASLHPRRDRFRIAGFFSVLACAGLATAAAAQTAAPRAAAPRAAPAGPSVGASATYRWISSVSQPVVVLVQQPGSGGAPPTVSVTQEQVPPDPIHVTVGVVRGDGRTYTLQIVTREQPDGVPLSVTQVTVNRASGRTVRAVTRGAKGPTATPESGLRPMRERGIAQGRRGEVTVPAGRFEAVQGTAGGAEVWVSDRVPPLGIVKAVWPTGTLELVRSAPSGTTDLLRTATR